MMIEVLEQYPKEKVVEMAEAIIHVGDGGSWPEYSPIHAFATDLKEKGIPESQAYRVAISLVNDYAMKELVANARTEAP